MSRDETGGIITGWLMQLVVFMAVLAFISHDVISVAITALQLDNLARDTAEVAAQAYDRSREEERSLEEADAFAERNEAQARSLEIDGHFVKVTIEKQADTWWAHRLGFLEDLISPSAEGRARWQ